MSRSHESDDDDAPEAVPMAVAKSEALASRESEKQAHQSAKAAAVLKRKRQPIAALPVDVLDAASAARKEKEQLLEQQQLEQEQAEEAEAKPKKTHKPATHVRRFGTIQVTTLDAPLPVADALTDAAKAFMLQRTAPGRPRSKAVEATRPSSRRRKK